MKVITEFRDDITAQVIADLISNANRPAIRANISSDPARHAARPNVGGAATA